MSRLTLPRALTAHIARRVIRVATFIAFGAFASVVLLCAVLAYFFAGWWWLLLIPFVFLLAMFLVVRIIVTFIVGRIHTDSLTGDQKQGLDDFTAKIERLIEARGTPPIFFALITIKDLLLHKDVTTIKELIHDTATLRRDFENLEKLF